MPERRPKGTGSYTYRPAEGRWLGTLRRRGKAYYVTVRGPKDSRTEARMKAALRDLAADLAEGRSTSNQTVESFLRYWLDEVKAPNRQAKTVDGYRNYIERHLIPEIGKIPLRELTVQDVQVAMNAIARKHRGATGRALSARTVHHARSILHAAMQQALAEGLVMRNPAEAVSITPARKHEVTPLDGDQARTFLAHLQGHHDEPLYLVALSTGLRQGEILGLRWKDFDQAARRLHIRQKLSRVRGESLIAVPKTASSGRTIVTPNILIGALQMRRVQWAEEKLAAGKHWTRGSDLIFSDALGRPLIGSTVTHRFKRLLKAADLPEIAFHDLRHSAASLLLHLGVPLRDIADLLGHSGIEITANLYGHLYDERREELAAKMDALLSPASDQ